MTGDGTYIYNYDCENRLIEVTDGGSDIAKYYYDYAGRRVAKVAANTETTYHYDGPQVIAEYEDGTLADIHDLRCDGLVEVCYEKNGINVWAMERDYDGVISYNFDISSQSDILAYDALWGTWSAGHNDAKDNLEEHNDYDNVGWSDTFLPATQCGFVNPVDSATTFSEQDLCYPIGHKGGN